MSVSLGRGRISFNNKSLDPRVNFRIRVPQVRLIDHDGGQLGVVDTKDAQKRAQEAGLDLVEVAPLERPPVCRIMDYGKFKYQQKKKQQKHHGGQLKGIRLSPKIQEHDLSIKVEQAKRFLERGDKVIASMMFRGREMAHIDIGRGVMDNFLTQLGEFAKVEKAPQMDNRKLNAIVAPGRLAHKTAAKPKEPKPRPAGEAAPTADAQRKDS